MQFLRSFIFKPSTSPMFITYALVAGGAACCRQEYMEKIVKKMHEEIKKEYSKDENLGFATGRIKVLVPSHGGSSRHESRIWSVQNCSWPSNRNRAVFWDPGGGFDENLHAEKATHDISWLQIGRFCVYLLCYTAERTHTHRTSHNQKLKYLCHILGTLLGKSCNHWDFLQKPRSMRV